VKELKVDHGRLGAMRKQGFVESGEGIERISLLLSVSVSFSNVESGEGIESRLRRAG